MAFTKEQLYAVMTGTDLNHRVEALRQLLGYPVKELDPERSRFWYLRPGADEEEAKETCPIAVAFYPVLTQTTDSDIKTFLTSVEQEQWLCGHYTNRVTADKPVMYLLLPEAEQAGRVAMILPGEGRKLRHRQIQTFAWNEEDLQARLARLQLDSLRLTNRIKPKALLSMPLVEWAFYKPIETARELAQLLAKAAHEIEQVIPKVYNAEGTDGYLHKLLLSFQKELLPALELTSDNEKDYSFADIYAQTIAYALFTARVFGYVRDKREDREKETHFDRESAWQQLPETNPFLRKLFQDVSERSPEELGDELVGAIAEIFGILRAAKMEAILSDFQMKTNREDIVIRFYEDFLAAYKPKMRERRGVYYTPEPVVSYMVRSVDEMLKDKFNKPLGLADPEVMILDPACGTGTFLLWICQLIYQRFQELPEALTEGLVDKSWSGYVKERLLPRIFGFELLMAPYAIAHLKLGLFLEETGYQFTSGKRLGVYLTNTLDDSIKSTEVLLEEYIAEESDQAIDVKRDKRITVVIGNPPYSISSANKGIMIERLMGRYKEAVRGERNIQPLSDDYIKFVRFSHDRIERSGFGIIGLITNSKYLSGASIHRGMREELLKTFSESYILNLHGDMTEPLFTAKGEKDENIFDIREGVAISFHIKVQKSISNTCLNYVDLIGPQSQKYQYLNKLDIFKTTWNQVFPTHPQFFFIPKNFIGKNEYDKCWQLNKIFKINSSGVKTHRDNFLIDNDELSLKNRINLFLNKDLSEDKIKEIFNVGKLNVENARIKLHKDKLWEQRFIRYLYRPFNIKSIFYSAALIDRPRPEVMPHMLYPNIGLVANRTAAKKLDYTHFLVCDTIIDVRTFPDFEGAPYLFPLYLYPDASNSQQSVLEEQRRPNLSQSFLNIITDKLGYSPTPEDIFYYIYAIFHSPTYRIRYAEFLKIDFPRVPLTDNDELFHQLATYGEELAALHLMKSPKLDNLITQFVNCGSSRVVDAGHPKFSQGEVAINKKGDRFTGVPENVWNFQVGGYQVCQKWLKDRKGSILSNDDIQHYQRIVVALKETIELMAKIDAAIPAWPIQ